MDLTEEELALQTRVMESLGHKREEVITYKKQAVQKWNSEREKNEEYIEQIKRNKEARKKELEDFEALKASLALEEDEDCVKCNDIDLNKEVNETVDSVEPVDNKPFKPKEQVELEKALNDMIKPFDVQSMDACSLKSKVKELWGIIRELDDEKQQLSIRWKNQEDDFKNADLKLEEKIAAKAAKKGVDMEKFYPGKHPPKMQIVSKWVTTKKGERTYGDRKEMYDTGCDIVRPKMLEDMWNTKFSAWMETENFEETD